MVIFNIEYLKIAGYVIAGYATARAWFHKEIAVGKAWLGIIRSRVKNAETAIATEIKKIEGKL